MTTEAKKYEELKETDYEFCINRARDIVCSFSIPDEVMDWYHSLASSEGYLVRRIKDSAWGFLRIEEFEHMGQPMSSSGYEWARENNRDEETVVKVMKEIANAYTSNFEFETFLGFKTGPDECHELAVFYPFNKSKVNEEKHANLYLFNLIKSTIEATFPESKEEGVNVWLRLGVGFKLTKKEIQEFAKYPDEFLVKVLKSGRASVNGDWYVPEEDEVYNFIEDKNLSIAGDLNTRKIKLV